MRLEKETSIYQLGAIATDITNAMTLANGKNKIFYQDTAPATGMSEGDLWFKIDSNGGSSLYEYKKTSSSPDTFAWTIRQLGQGSLVAGSVTANEINVNNLSAISGILGSVTVGGANNADGVITIKNASNQTIGSWDNTGIDANKGTIGPWTIGSTGIYDEKSAFHDDGTSGVYLGNDGVALENADGLVRIGVNGNVHIEDKGGGQTYIALWDSYNRNMGISANSIHATDLNDGSYVVMEVDGITVSDRLSNRNITIGYSDGCLKFNSPVDAALLKNTYGSTKYNLIRNHNNGNISVSASSGTLYLGYENTTGINFLNGKATIDSNGCFEVIRSSGSAWMQAKNANNGNGIWMQAETAGTVTLGSRGANGTTYDIFRRANNANTITAYCVWTFNNTVTANVVAPSDCRLKENIEDCKVSALPVINAIKMREFDWVKDKSHQRIGVIADELEQIDSKFTYGGGYAEDGSMNVKSVDTFYLEGYLIKAVQELSAKVSQLEERIRVLEGGNNDVGMD